MSVVSGKRNVTKFDYYDLAMHLKCIMTKFLMCNFGTSKSYKDIRFFTGPDNKMLEEDIKALDEIINRYGKNISFETSFPYWVIEHIRERLMTLLDNLMDQVTELESIYPASIPLFNLKLNKVTGAINTCQCILSEFQSMVMIFNSNRMDLSAFDPYIDEINTLISKLRDARKRVNGQRAYAYQKDIETHNKADFYISNNIRIFNPDGSVKSCDEFKKNVKNFNKKNQDLLKSFNALNESVSHSIANSKKIITNDEVIITARPITLGDTIIKPTFSKLSNVDKMVYDESGHWYMSDTVKYNDDNTKTYTSRNYTYNKGENISPAAIFDAVIFDK
ncbi:MAG: hypothetical protein IKR19_08460 [Acholeplasmatales bacterium]|nr:hypothetical protein [Acholeplasmatales bacterium]